VERRYKAYDKDIEHWEDYDYVLINENLENCYKQIENIISINKDKSFKVSQKIQ
jgi:guanylate kinase